MMRIVHALAFASTIALAAPALLLAPASPARAAMPVFDPTNYAQNLLQAARALEQVNNQVRSLQNETDMLRSLGKHLERIDFPELGRVKAAMERIEGLMGEARGIGFEVDRLDERFRAMFPARATRCGTAGVAEAAPGSTGHGRLSAQHGRAAQWSQNVRGMALLADLNARSQVPSAPCRRARRPTSSGAQHQAAVAAAEPDGGRVRSGRGRAGAPGGEEAPARPAASWDRPRLHPLTASGRRRRGARPRGAAAPARRGTFSLTARTHDGRPQRDRPFHGGVHPIYRQRLRPARGRRAFLTTVLVGIDITLAGLFWAMGGEDDVIGRFLKKILYVGAFALILGNFQTLADIIFRSFAGPRDHGWRGHDERDDLLRPGHLAGTGFQAAWPLLDQASRCSVSRASSRIS
jgi:P-type conjugative transfer protein TrbJ